MTPVLAWIVRLIGWQGCLLLAFYVYEEGIPGAHRIPFLSSIPVIGDLTTGRVHSYAADQVRLATAGMVAKTENDALASQLATERKRAADAAKALDEYRKSYAAIVEANKANRERSERDIEEDNRNEDGAPRVTDSDLRWLELRNGR